MGAASTDHEGLAGLVEDANAESFTRTRTRTPSANRRERMPAGALPSYTPKVASAAHAVEQQRMGIMWGGRLGRHLRWVGQRDADVSRWWCGGRFTPVLQQEAER